MLINVFIDRIYLYDDKYTIFFNASDKAIEIDYAYVKDKIKSKSPPLEKCSHERSIGVIPFIASTFR
jgi:hypothetical protein